MKSILLTGTAGFIGSNFVPYFLEKYPNYNLVNLDLLTYAGDLQNLKECENHPRYKFIKGDICNRELVEFIFNEYDIRGVIHFAAESHVDNSIKNPGVFVQTNVTGTFTLVDVAYKYWMEKPFVYKERFLVDSSHSFRMTDSSHSEPNHRHPEPSSRHPEPSSRHPERSEGSNLPRFHHISTDEVYGTLNETDLFTEKTPYAPNSPYSASKASSDMIIRAYNETYGLNTVITNCSNNYGPKQHDEKLIPTIIRNALKGNPIPIYGDGKNIRDWLYVLDHCKGIDLVYHNGKKGETYNIGGRNERTNLQIVDKICEILDEKVPLIRHSEQSEESLRTSTETLHSLRSLRVTNLCHPEQSEGSSYKDLITFVEDRAGHDRRYAIDATKLENELGWKADENFDTGIVKTIEWYLNKYGITK
ncbi:dTDP-glucose 4,6-dehydratase [Sulfurimonas xiamenensis]|uniref:dTDP-glucose 4,6-dehydratase n=1 Tax=Sulfurimonas xiamenensis TaxID=2590021 RepID=A0AAJ4DLW2_9BACT|nr:dTDP-glucose 4,6-dehydratase [Sulfurimonas xiamenensis]QFR42548.1 dTDP-glucose 4,6-dehydratase [Sulfurimonas xiamenensis]